MEYIEPDDVDELVRAEGFHYRDRGLMLSALAAPLPVFGEEVHPGVHRKAAVLMTAINRDHPLLDGNKRLSWFVTVAFYDLNGYDLDVPPHVANRYVRMVAAGEAPLHDVELWLDKYARASHGAAGR
jgi:death-on-curing protein